MTLRAALFDFDETLINLQAHHFAAERAMLAAYGYRYDALPDDLLRGTSGRRIVDILADIRNHFGITEPVAAMLAARQAHFLNALRDAPELPPLPGAVEAVRTLHAAGYTLAIVTSGIREYVTLVLDRLGIAGYFTLIVTGADVTHAKPHPEPYQIAAARLGIAPAECVVFEDAAIGVAAAKAAGMRCIAVPNPDALLPQDLAAADLVLPSLTQFSPALLAAW